MLVLALTVAVLAVVLPTEGGDVFYFAFGGEAGAVNAFGQTLWAVPGELIATDAVGSCLAVARAEYNNTAFLGTSVALYTPDGRRMWSARVRINATALATSCVEVAVGGVDGTLLRIRDGQVAGRERHDKPIFALAYRADGTLAVGAGDPVGGFTTYVDRCGNSITVQKADAPYLIIRSPKFGEVRRRGGLAPQLRPPAGASQDCGSFIYAVYDQLYNNTTPLIKLPAPVVAVAVSGDGRTAAAATVDRLYVIRGGRVAAELEVKSVVRSIALPWDGSAVAYASDSGVSVRRFKTVRIEARGCPLPAAVEVGGFTYVPPADAYVPAEASEVEADVAEGDALRCVPVQNRTRLLPHTVVEYRVEHRVEAPALVRGPRWASGPAAFYAEPELKAPADPPLREVTLRLADWEVNGTRRGLPLSTLIIEVNGPTRVRPVYQLAHPPEVVQGGLRYVVKSVALFVRSGRPMAEVDDVPAYARIQYEVYRLLAWEAPGNSSAAWLREGEEALLRAPAEINFGNGTRLVFRQWSTGEKSAAVAVGPGRYEALYDVYHLVAFHATNYSHAQWVKRGVGINAPRVGKVYDDGQTRIYVVGWTADGRPVQFPHVVAAPVNFTAVERREHYTTVVVWDRREEGWRPHGHELAVEEGEKAKWLIWRFKGWEPGPVVEAPGVYRAVYEPDPLAASVVAIAAAGAVGIAAALRRR